MYTDRTFNFVEIMWLPALLHVSSMTLQKLHVRAGKTWYIQEGGRRPLDLAAVAEDRFLLVGDRFLVGDIVGFWPLRKLIPLQVVCCALPQHLA